MHSVVQILRIILQIYGFMFFIYIMMSYFPIGRDNFFVRVLTAVVEPVYKFIMRYLPPLQFGMMDLSPIYVFMLLWLLDMLLSLIAR